MAKKDMDIGMSDEEFERQYIEATRHGQEELKKLPKAAAAKYDKRSRRIVLDLENGVTALVPVDLVQGLQGGNDRQLGDFSLMFQGTEIFWESLDVQFFVGDLLSGVFGTKRWMAGLKEHLAEIGRKGGRARTPAKRAASAENGKKGGRPQKVRTA